MIKIKKKDYYIINKNSHDLIILNYYKFKFNNFYINIENNEDIKIFYNIKIYIKKNYIIF